MPRWLLVCAVLVILPALAHADGAGGPTETVVHFAVQPMAAPKPALRYQLLPELKEMNPGNPIHAYLKCFMEQQNFFFGKEAVDNREKWQTMPLAELPLKELKDYGRFALRQADWAARLDAPDWGILLQAKRDGMNLLLPDVQQMRMLASALKVRFRAEVAECRFEDAIRTAKTIFGEARHLGEHPTLIGDLVGIAVAMVGIGPLEEMIQQPGCPNLYWALSDLPNPFIDLRKGIQGERLLLEADLAGFDLTEPLSEAQQKKLVAKVKTMLQYTGPGGKQKDVEAWLEARVKDEGHRKAARRRLVEAGLAEEQIKALPPLQVVLLDEKHQFEVWRDGSAKWMMLPYWQAEPGLLVEPTPPRDDPSLFGPLLSANQKVRRAQARLEQRIALLRHVEALRLYAAENDGKLPVQLSDVKVPLPVDPVTGKPFIYKVEGATATLKGTPPRGEEANPVYNVRYEVTIKK
jgi:hypothetical protein